MRHGSLFSGIGGFDLAAQWMGWDNVFHVERNPFCQKVLSYHFPQAKSYEDIKEFDGTEWRGKVDIISGGFPCQPYSTAGKRLGKDDERHLWPEMLRIIREAAPRFVVGENVRGLTSWNGGVVFEEVCLDLEAEGYDVWAGILPAAGVGAPHRRERIFFVAHAHDHGAVRTSGGLQSEEGAQRLQERHGVSEPYQPGSVWDATNTRCSLPSWKNFPTQPPVCGGDDGLPRELDGITFPKWRNESVKAYGNAICPQVAYEIFQSLSRIDIIIGSKQA